MHKFVILFFFAFFIFMNSANSATPVSDIKSYTYWAEQLRHELAKIELMRQNLLEAKKKYDLALSQANDLKKQYYRVVGTMRWLDQLQQDLRHDPESVMDRWLGFTFHDMAQDFDSLFANNYSDSVYMNAYLLRHPEALEQDTKKAWAGLKSFAKKRPTINYGVKSSLDDIQRKKRHLITQNMLKASFEKSNYLLDTSSEDSKEEAGYKRKKIETQAQLAKNVNNAKNLKDASEITNTILLQILETQNQMLFLQAQMVMIYSSMHSTGQGGTLETQIRLEKLEERRKEVLKRPDVFQKMIITH